MKRAFRPPAILVAAAVFAAGILVAAPAEPQSAPVAKILKRIDPGDRALLGQAPAASVETVKISSGDDSRYPGVAENASGDRLVIFAGSDNLYRFSFYKKGGAWTTPAVIPNQPQLSKVTCVDVEADGTGRFHCVWEQPQSAAVYATCLNGVWTAPSRLPLAGGYDMSSAIAIRSDDEVVLVNGQIVNIGSLTKDIFLYTKGRGESDFRTPINLTTDRESSAMPHVAVGPDNHAWVTYKSDLFVPGITDDILVIYVNHLDADNQFVERIMVSEDEGWGFWPQVAVNGANKVMTVWPFSQSGDYWSRLYDPATKNLSSRIPLKTGISTNPWCTFYTKLVARGEDFYAAILNPGRILFLMKFDEASSSWLQAAQVSDRAVQYFDLYSGSDRLLLAWGSNDAPADVFLTAVEANVVISDKYTLTIQAGTGGTTTPSAGTYRHDKGSQITVKAVANAGNRFTGWSGDASGTSATISVTMDANKTVKANFIAVPARTLTIQAGEGGTTDPAPGAYQRDQGSQVGVWAVPNDGYRFAGWSGDASGEIASITITMDRDKTVKADFAFIPVAKRPLDPVLQTALDASQASKTNVLAWSPNPENAGTELKEYWIYRKRSAGPDSEFVKVGSVGAAAFQYADGGLSCGQKYGYMVTAIPKDPYGKESAASDVVIEVIAFPPLAAACKTVSNASLFRTEKINVVTWRPNPLNEPNTVAQYNIYRKKAGETDAGLKLVGTVAGTAFEYQDRRLSFDDSFVYVVRTVDSGGFESGNSNPAGETG